MVSDHQEKEKDKTLLILLKSKLQLQAVQPLGVISLIIH